MKVLGLPIRCRPVKVSATPRLWLTRWYRCCAAFPLTSLPPPLSSCGRFARSLLLGNTSLRISQWSFEGNKTLPLRQTVTGTGEALGRKPKGEDRRSSKTRFWFLTAPDAPPVWSRAVKFPQRTPQRRFLLLKLKSYLMMTEHPSWETAVSPKVADL